MIFYFNKKRGGRPCFFCGVFYVFFVLCIVARGDVGEVVVIGKEFFSVVFVVVCAWMCGLFWDGFGLGRTL